MPPSITVRVLSVAHLPVVEPRSGRTLPEVLGWYDWRQQERQFVRDVAQASHGLLSYEVVDRVTIDSFPRLADGFAYDAATYLRCWQRRAGFHTPEGVDYDDLLRGVRAFERIDAGEI